MPVLRFLVGTAASIVRLTLVSDFLLGQGLQLSRGGLPLPVGRGRGKALMEVDERAIEPLALCVDGLLA